VELGEGKVGGTRVIRGRGARRGEQIWHLWNIEQMATGKKGGWKNRRSQEGGPNDGKQIELTRKACGEQGAGG